VFKSGKYSIPGNISIREKIVPWLNKFEVFCLFDSHSERIVKHPFSFSTYDLIVAVDAEIAISPENGNTFEDLDKLHAQNPDWYAGFLSYELKNRFENLHSENICNLDWPEFYFFKPKFLLLINNGTVEVNVSANSAITPEKLWKDILSTPLIIKKKIGNSSVKVFPRVSKSEYISGVSALKKHILLGDIYEVNYCQEFFACAEFDPLQAFLKMHQFSPAPFSVLLKLNNKYLLSASPERFLRKSGHRILSQPIKGTARRGTDLGEDEQLVAELKNSKKEHSENIMIVDLVRNDLSKIATTNSVSVDELCGIYSFEFVHQMISTVSATLKTDSFAEIMKATFPMGSMTGAPKLNALKLAGQYEKTSRGIYSGAIGYITPSKDFDFNVVIRSIQYNSENMYLSYMVGSAVTFLSDAEKEYEECLIKARAMEILLK
jgi:para-aminobenzoate synthetase component I